ncbi:MAG: panT [Firmicutes bacterium]|nr:panT [Bacillota bacterium]
MKSQEYSKPLLSVRQLTVVAMLAAVSVVLGVSGYGFIPLPMIKATVMHIPVIIGAILEGPRVGVMVGLLFGLFSILQNILAPNLLSFALLNPLVSVVPRILIGLVAYYCYKVAIGNAVWRIGLGAVLGSLVNTVGVMGMIYLLYVADFAAAKGISLAAARAAIGSVIIVNGIPEAIISALITIPVILMLKKMRGLR